MFSGCWKLPELCRLLCQCGLCPCSPCTQVYGATYLQKLLEPLLRTVITSPEWQHVSFEVDPTRFEIQGEQQMYLFVNMIPTHSCNSIPFSLLQIFLSCFHTVVPLTFPDTLIVSAALLLCCFKLFLTLRKIKSIHLLRSLSKDRPSNECFNYQLCLPQNSFQINHHELIMQLSVGIVHACVCIKWSERMPPAAVCPLLSFTWPFICTLCGLK